jgi:hypothetical protein
MESTKRTRLIAGVIFILAGFWFFAVQTIPGLSQWFRFDYSWPMIIIAVGFGLLLLGLLTGANGMAVPACIVGGIGLISYFQNISGNWISWAYSWTLIPGFVGVGLWLSGLLGGSTRANLKPGLRLITISLVLFLVFGFFFGGFATAHVYAPLALVAAGILILVNTFIR